MSPTRSRSCASAGSRASDGAQAADRNEIVGLITGAIDADREGRVMVAPSRPRGRPMPVSGGPRPSAGSLAVAAGDQAAVHGRRGDPALRRLRRDAVRAVPQSADLDQHPAKRGVHRHRRLVHYPSFRQRRAGPVGRQPLRGRRHGKRRISGRRTADPARYPLGTARRRCGGTAQRRPDQLRQHPALHHYARHALCGALAVVYFTGGQPITRCRTPLPTSLAPTAGPAGAALLRGGDRDCRAFLLETTIFGGASGPSAATARRRAMPASTSPYLTSSMC